MQSFVSRCERPRAQGTPQTDPWCVGSAAEMRIGRGPNLHIGLGDQPSRSSMRLLSQRGKKWFKPSVIQKTPRLRGFAAAASGWVGPAQEAWGQQGCRRQPGQQREPALGGREAFVPWCCPCHRHSQTTEPGKGTAGHGPCGTTATGSGTSQSTVPRPHQRPEPPEMLSADSHVAQGDDMPAREFPANYRVNDRINDKMLQGTSSPTRS